MYIGSNTDNSINNTFLTPDGLAMLLSVSKATVYRLIDKRQVPFHKIGGSIRFFKDDVEEYLGRIRVEPIVKM